MIIISTLAQPHLARPATNAPLLHVVLPSLTPSPPQAYDITHLVPEVPREGSRRARNTLDPDLLDAIDTSELEPFQVCVSSMQQACISGNGTGGVWIDGFVVRGQHAGP